jgi:hypothetical protein
MIAAMKTGRLLKFHRPGGEVHAYLYQEAGAVYASVYLLAPGHGRRPVHEVSGGDSEAVEADVRAWVEAHFPRPS